MVVIMRAVVGFAAIGTNLQFARKRSRPFLPGEMTLLGELDREPKGLRLPRFGEHRPAFVAGQLWQRRQTHGIRRVQGNRPTYRDRRNPWASPARPRVRVPRSARNRDAAVFLRGTRR